MRNQGVAGPSCWVSDYLDTLLSCLLVDGTKCEDKNTQMSMILIRISTREYGTWWLPGT